MSRTCHALPTRSFRNMRVQNRRKAEESALDHLIENEVCFRHVNRLTSFWTIIPDPWDDKPATSWKEYHNKTYWPKKLAQNNEHYTRKSS